MSTIDYKKLDLKVGLELHQQLNADEKKLFCGCRAELSEKSEYEVIRKLRPTQSELGEMDPAALFEFQRNRKFVYLGNSESSCLVEVDEEPPHKPNEKAIDISLMIALMMNAKPVNEIHVSRKSVLDGSSVFGFQRTMLVATSGGIVVDGKEVPIQAVYLEEDACRPDKMDAGTVYYRLDRLGVPLIEVVTGPVIYSPEEAVKVAAAIGKLLRATKCVRRGIGTIRQDLNVSILGGNVIEVKGVQELQLLSDVIEHEVQRQLNLLKIRDELIKRGVLKEAVVECFVDVSDVFGETKSNIIKKALQNKGVALAVKLPGFASLLKFELEPGIRFGTELSDQAKFWGGLGGLFHSDELPAYGVSVNELSELKKAVKASDIDGVVLVADDSNKCVDALRAVVRRSIAVFDGVPDETRSAYPDGTSHYTRPKPGAARMYPETDIPPITITSERINRIRSEIPELPEDIIVRLINQYGINRKLATQLMDLDYVEFFESISKRSNVSPTFVAACLTETLRSLKREGVSVEKVSAAKLMEVFELIGSNFVAKESFPEIVECLAENESYDAKSAVEHLGLKMLSANELDKIIVDIVKSESQLIKDRGIGAVSALMGIVMSKVRGKADAKIVAERVKEKIEKTVASG